MLNAKKLLKKYPASQNPEELQRLLDIVKDLNPKNVLEIGVHQGYSLAIWKEIWPGAIVVGIDNDLHALDREATKDCVVMNENSHFSNVAGKASYHMPGGVDFLFIDGDHMESGVKMDFKYYGPLVKKGGIVAFHDIALKNNPGVEVYKFWEGLKENADERGFKYEELIADDGTGTGVLFV